MGAGKWVDMDTHSNMGLKEWSGIGVSASSLEVAEMFNR